MKVSLMFNNYATIFYALFTAIWGVVFLELWKRRQATLACEWDVAGDTWAASLDQPRPDYVAAAREQRPNAVTGEWEAYIPARTRYQRIIASITFVSFLVVIVVAVIMGARVRSVQIITCRCDRVQDGYDYRLLSYEESADQHDRRRHIHYVHGKHHKQCGHNRARK
jgi:hypothetical protein